MAATQHLFSVGHSNQSAEEFIDEIRSFGVNCIVDVRSMPYSKFTPQFNAEALGAVLKRNGIAYLPFGAEFGARRTDSFDYDNLLGVGFGENQVVFELAAQTPAFQRGVERINNGLAKGFVIALMCSEADPLECHRFSLVSRYFFDHGYEVEHILSRGVSASHCELQNQLIAEYVRKGKLPEIDLLFGEYTEQDQIRDAYRLKNKSIGYKTEMTEDLLSL